MLFEGCGVLFKISVVHEEEEEVLEHRSDENVLRKCAANGDALVRETRLPTSRFACSRDIDR